MKRNAKWLNRLSVLALLTALFLCVCCAAALAADEIPIKVQMTVDPNTFTGPATANVEIRITNVSDRDLPGPVTLYYPNGKQIEEFGAPVLASGASATWSGTWDVTQANLKDGKINFRVKYSIYSENGEVVDKASYVPKPITFVGSVVSAEVTRVIVPTTAGKGQQVSITYDVVNTGNVDITDVTISEQSAISSKKGVIGTIKAGSKGTYTFTFTMGSKSVTSKPTITYKADGQSYTITKDAATINYGEIKLSAKLSADKKGGLIGETVLLTLVLRNTGKEDFENVTVTDSLLGELFSGETVRAGESLTLEKAVPIDRTADYQFIITAVDTAGSSVEVASDRVSVTAIEPGQVVSLDVNLTADRDVVYILPSTVRFYVSVTNNSGSDLRNVTVTSGELTLYTFPTLLAGETRSFQRDVQIEMAGRFQLQANVRNQLNETQTFSSNVLPIVYTAPTPVPTEAPIVTPPAPNFERLPSAEDLPEWYDTVGKGLNWAAIGLAALAAIGAVLLLIGGINRLRARGTTVEPIDELDSLEMRSYDQKTDEQNSHFVDEFEASTSDEMAAMQARDEDDLSEAINSRRSRRSKDGNA